MYIIVHAGVLVPFSRTHARTHAGLRAYMHHLPAPLHLVAGLMGVRRARFYTRAEYITCNMKVRKFILRL